MPAKKPKTDDGFERALRRMGGIDPDRDAKCKTVAELDALRREARGHGLPGLRNVPGANPNGNGFIEVTVPAASPDATMLT